MPPSQTAFSNARGGDCFHTQISGESSLVDYFPGSLRTAYPSFFYMVGLSYLREAVGFRLRVKGQPIQ